MLMIHPADFSDPLSVRKQTDKQISNSLPAYSHVPHWSGGQWVFPCKLLTYPLEGCVDAAVSYGQ